MSEVKKILVIQTAFIGDLMLALPLVQVLKENFPSSEIDMMCIPETSILLKHNLLVNEVLVYDKRGTDAGFSGMLSIVKKIKTKKYDLIISPHRSYRTSLICAMSGCKKTIGFDISGLSFLFKEKVKYVQDVHEIVRNLSLLKPVGLDYKDIIRPEIFLSETESEKIDDLLSETGTDKNEKFVTIAPASVWFTKQYPKEKFLKLINSFLEKKLKVFLIGGSKDEQLKNYFDENVNGGFIVNTIGKLNLLESAELIKRSALLIANDSAPVHIANAVATKVVVIYGATVPQFGFYPYGEKDFIFETNGLKCRPCSIHGGHSCPIGTFECMNSIDELRILSKAVEMI